jgi:hypothetical protein
MASTEESQFKVLVVTSTEFGKIRYSFEYATLQDHLEYDYLTCMNEKKAAKTRLVIDEEWFNIPVFLLSGICQLMTKQKERRLWIDQLCASKLKRYSKQEEELKRKIRSTAKHSFIWIGDDHEDLDLLDGFLGTGSPDSTKWAFDFANKMINGPSDAKDLDEKIEIRAPTGKPAWCYLARLLYRPWYRELPLLNTNLYLHDLTVICGTSSIKWYDLWSAVGRVKELQPVPFLIDSMKDGAQCWTKAANEFVPGVPIRELIRWIRAREILGFDNLHLYAKLMLLIREARKAGPSKKRHVLKLLWLQRSIHSLSPIVGTRKERLKYWIKQVNQERDDPDRYADRILPFVDNLPTLPLTKPLYPPPKPEHQKGFVYSRIDATSFMRLLILLPHQGDSSAPIQCELRIVSRDDPPPFTFVDRGALTAYKRPAKAILVNNQCLRVPQAFEVLLRHLCHESQERSLFYWRTCVNEELGDEVSLGRPDGLSLYFQAKSFLQEKANSTIDMYVELRNVCRDVGGWPEGMTNAEWLLNVTEKQEVEVYIEDPMQCPDIDWSRPMARRYKL